MGKYNTCFKTLIESSYFGEIELYQNSSRLFTIQASSECHLLIIRKEDFERILSSFPDYEAQAKEIAHKKLLHINESLEKIKDLQTIRITSDFWGKQTKNIYQLVQEEKQNSHRNSQILKLNFKHNHNDKYDEISETHTSRPFLYNEFPLKIKLNNEKNENNENNENKAKNINNINLDVEQKFVFKTKILQKQSSIISLIGVDNLSTPKTEAEFLNFGESNSHENNSSQENKSLVPVEKKVHKRKSQFFYGVVKEIIKNEKNNQMETENCNELISLKEEIKGSEKIVNASERELKEISESIEEMRQFICFVSEKKKMKNMKTFDSFL